MTARFRTGSLARLALGLAMVFAFALDEIARAQGQPAPGARTAVVGSKNSKIYHALGCGSARRLTLENRIVFPSLAVAEAQGFRACRNCKPNRSISMASTPAGPDPSVQDDRDEGVTFSADIAPVLVANCTRCHNPEDRRGTFDMSTFRKLMTGSEAGAVIVPGKPEESELVLRIKGQSTPKMPPGNDNLASETIDRIEQWIKEGALLDPGADPNAALADVAASPEDLQRAELARLTPEERTRRLTEIAQQRWARAGAEGEPTLTASEHFAFFSDIAEDRAEATLQVLEQAHESLRGLLSRPSKPVLDGPMKISIYVFANQNHYAEFARSVARQEPHPDEKARADLSGTAPYLVALDPRGGTEAEPVAGSDDEAVPLDRSLNGLLVEQLAVGAVNQAEGNAPRWLALGLGAFMASKVDPRNPYANRLRAETLRAYQIGWTTKANEALGDVSDPEELRALGFSMLEWLTTVNRRAVGPFVRGMLGGKDQLDDGARYLFGATREQLLMAWGRWVGSRYGRGR